ncbi:Por secretion system C-terminal sorting domain-containing protein [Chryseobacterium taichungense]|uniref:Por secretion system C-terminal sorting domain-containing protein n=1 Tax=Chryseobacterium taichungense TaxID=295069 RepID=A0A1H8BLH1_9FLAO|nr:T9SS type A sorting domain-containing protein [Chryseobacterium taichungense]SEM83339.1 Por secretion system C-terminal sorting domain-containing protein [Chryseobacterium taichungense]
MKKVLFSFMAFATAGLMNAQVITQNATPNTVAATGSVACASGSTSTNYYTADNSYLRLFKLSDYGINYNYRITNIAFGVQLASRTIAGSSTDVGGAFPVEVWLYTTSATTLDPLDLTSVSGDTPLTTVNVSSANNAAMVNTGTSVNQIIPAGSNFVIEIWHDGATGHTGTSSNPYERFYMGTNTSAQTGPSYLVSETCGLTDPIATGTGALAGFASAKWVMTITGQNSTLGTTEVINSPDLQIYPNPVKDVLKFKLFNNLKSESIDIYDLNGRVITSISNSKNVNEVNMSSYAKGNYILRVKASDGKVYIQKIIKD